MYQPTIDPKSEFPLRWSFADVLLPLAIVAFIFIIVHTASDFTGAYDSGYVINLSLTSLPAYALQTLVRMLAAYSFSLISHSVIRYSPINSCSFIFTCGGACPSWIIPWAEVGN